MESKKVLSDDIAIQEIKTFLSDYLDAEFDVKKDYPKVLDAVVTGRLILSDDGPIYNLIKPINESSDEFKVSELKFKTRILPNTMASLAKGIDLKNDAVKYSLVCISHIIGMASVMELDKFSKKDYGLIQELSTVFM